MTCFSNSIKFKYPWRIYQNRVLSELDRHLTDNHLHIIAPPGSGKTVLGLEVMLRIGEPTLILAPTIAIKNQWIQRFCDLFLQDMQEPEWISRDIRKPKLITVVTYQGLHAACHSNDQGLLQIDYEHELDLKESKKSNFLNVDNILKGLLKVGVKTIIVDEAHHLKNEWWKTLTRLKNGLSPKVVGLTATPPYDVSPNEWLRYIDLNGPVDAEISVPELIKEGDLCVHQDYVFLCEADESIKHEMVEFRAASQMLYEQLLVDDNLFEAVSNHPIWLDPVANQNRIYENLSFYSASIIYLHHRGVGVFPIHLEILGLQRLKERETVEDKIQIPALSYEWMQELLQFYLFEQDGFFQENFNVHRKTIEGKLRRQGVLDRNRVRFDYNESLAKNLATSINKLEAIKNIVDLEFRSLGTNLRQVILTDYIRKEYLSTHSVNELPLTRIGVISIFEHLRRSNSNEKKIAVLTGGIIILPISSVPAFVKNASNLNWNNVDLRPLIFDNDYVEVIQAEASKNKALRIVTDIFEAGEIEILIGTKSLLGEGWDAPAINSLVLATFVGSYVSSNQMRGRAIRTQKNNPDKSSNIWHIAAVDPTSSRGGTDLSMMKRRFRNFVGVSEYDKPNIENGRNRLLLPSVYTPSTITNYNQRTMELAIDRVRLKDRWQLGMNKGIQLVEEIMIPYVGRQNYESAKAASMQKYISNMLAGLASSLLFFVETSTQVLSKLVKVLPAQPSSVVMMGMLGVGAVFYGKQTFSSFNYYCKYRDITKDIYQIGNALLTTVCKAKIFTSPLDDLKVLTFGDAEGNVYCHLEGGTAYEKSCFIQMIQQIVNPIIEPRFLIIRKSKVLHFFNQQDYHAVPELLSKKVALANDFLKNWQNMVGEAELHYTKSIIGRRVLLQSKFNALANEFAHEGTIQPVSIWR